MMTSYHDLTDQIFPIWGQQRTYFHEVVETLGLEGLLPP
jgi:hypothetical protein